MSIKRFGLIIAAVISCISLLMPSMALAQDTTQPHEFYGDLRINGIAAPAGTIITAEINGIERGKLASTTVSGIYGGQDTFDTRLVVEGIEEDRGETIHFYINGLKANETAIFEPGVSTALNLSAWKYPLAKSDIQIEKALEYLRARQNANGSISGYVTSCWAIMAIDAAGEDPHDWESEGASLVDFIRDNANSNLDLNKATDWERTVLAIVAAEENPYSFGNIDYIQKILGFYDDTHSQMGDPNLLNDDIWGIFALSSVGAGKDIIPDMVEYIKANQNEDDGWSWVVGGPSDADNTAAAISALLAAGESSSSTEILKAVDYLKTQQQTNGGFVSEGTTNSGVDSWVIRAINDLGQDPTEENWIMGGNNPLEHLLSLQSPNGSFKWTASQASNPEWMTSYAVLALLGAEWPQDTSSPTIANITPASGATINSTETTISANYADSISGIDIQSVEFLLDNSNVSANSSKNNSGISYNASELSAGNHTVSLYLKDQAGNSQSQSWTFKVSISSGTGGGGGGAGDSPSPTPSPLPSGTISLENSISDSGSITRDIQIKSRDNKCSLLIENGVTALTADDQPLTRISVNSMTNPPPAPQQADIIGLSYDFGPDGASFDPPITLTFTYTDNQIPVGTDENNLKVATWDAVSGKWVELECTINPVTNTITAKVKHFCAFTIVAQTGIEAFSLSDLTLSKSEIFKGDDLSVSALATNISGISGTQDIKLLIDGKEYQSSKITLSSGQEETLSYKISANSEGEHTVTIGDLSTSFRVKPTSEALLIKSISANPQEAGIGEKFVFNVVIKNLAASNITFSIPLSVDNRIVETKSITLAGNEEQTVTFEQIYNEKALHSASIMNLSCPFSVIEKQPLSEQKSGNIVSPLNWGLIAGALAVILLIGFIILKTARSRR